MRLISVEVHGYKRFADVSKMNVDGKVVAIVGPNEAGKTSFLEALCRSEDEDPIQAQDRTRLAGVSDEQVVVELLYLLEPDDQDAVAHLHGPPARHSWLRVRKLAGGELIRDLEPRRRRDIESRKALIEPVRKLLRSPWLSEEIEPRDSVEGGDGEPQGPRPLEREAIEPVLEALATDRKTLAPEIISSLEAAIERLDSLDGGPRYAAKIVERARRVYEHESAEHPNDEALRILWGLLPEVIWFDEDERGLRFEYDLATEAEEPPRALANLARVGDLDLVAYRDAIAAADTGTAVQLLEDANAALRSEYGSWTQSGVRPHLDPGDGLLLHVHVSNEAGGYMKLNERSAGLRAYVAMVAAATAARPGAKPIFVVDEAEMHLHYDAQADLAGVFARQDAISQVIYTTHSAGCLPEDLGSCVRIVEPIAGTNHSRIWNKFWSDGPGFSPLLLGMGASTLAFFPTRDAVISEGPTELIMLGALLREAIGEDLLGFQIVPGSASARPSQVGGLDLEAPQMAWVVDGDDGGREITKKVLRGGVPADRIVAIGGSSDSGLMIEDLVAADVYARAINEEIGRRAAGEVEDVDSSVLGEKNRPAAVKVWCEARGIAEPDKCAVAHHIVEMKSTEKLVEPSQLETVKQLHADLVTAIERTD